MFKKVIIVLVTLCSLKFFSLIIIPEIVIKLSEWFGIGIILVISIIYLVYSREKLIKQKFVVPIVLIFISVLLSMFGSYVFQDQSFIITAYAQRAIYFYFIYFLLHLMKVDGDFIIRTILSIALIYITIYLIQYILYPIQITSTKMFLDRGTLRIFLSGLGYVVIAYFIWLYMILKKTKIRYVLFLILALTIFVLMGTRQVLATMFLLTILYILISKVVKSKLLFFVLIGIAVIPVFFLFKDIIFAMLEVTNEQIRDLEGSIRLEAARFFLTRFFPDELAYITGNGAEGSSVYGLRLFRYSEQYGYYLSDIGLIGEYVKYGIIYLVSVFVILYKVLKTALPEKLMFIKFNFLGIILTLVTGGGAFGTSENIIIICFLLYLIDLHSNNRDAFSNSLIINEQ